jgi:hypothetical protein
VAISIAVTTETSGAIAAAVAICSRLWYYMAAARIRETPPLLSRSGAVLRNVEDLLAERGIDISHETVRFWWNRFGPIFAAEIRKSTAIIGCPYNVQTTQCHHHS